MSDDQTRPDAVTAAYADAEKHASSIVGGAGLASSGQSYGLASGAALELGPPLPPTRAAALDRFVDAARRLKAAELEFRAAQQAYAEAVKELSEEATK